MAEREGYPAGVPCWIDTSQPDPGAAVAFYEGLFGWDCHDVMPPDAPRPYFIGRIRGGDVAAITALPDGVPAATWNTYIEVASADDAAAKVREAGGRLLTEPFDVMSSGRMAIVADTEGAAFCVWESKEHHGADVVNEHGALNFNVLNTRDPEAAKAFYGEVFGWGTLPMGPAAAWTLPGYGDHLEELNPGMRQGMQDMGAPEGFENVVASLLPITQDDTPPHWSVTFAVDDADAIAARAEELGATVVVPPFDAPWVKNTVIADPGGATFTAAQFRPENKDLVAEAGSTAGAA